MEEITLNEDEANNEESPALMTEDDQDDQQVENSRVEENLEVEDSNVEKNIDVEDRKDDLENDDADVLNSLVAKLQTLELRNTDYLNEIDNQKKVIELLRVEAENKDKECAGVTEELKEWCSCLKPLFCKAP